MEYKFGIIGCGMISNWHADAIMSIENASLAGATDVNKSACEAFAHKYGIKAYKSADSLMDDPEIDVVCICTPSGLHAPYAVKAAGFGKNIILEKPMALNLCEADEIIAACRKNNVLLSVISQLRFAPAVQKLKEAINSGILGRLVSGDIYMKYYRSQEYYTSGGWRGTWKMDGGGALMNQGIHGVDLLQYVMGPVKSVFAFARTLARNIEVEDTAAAVIEFRNGALGVIEGTTSVYPGSPRRLEICGDKGTITLEEDSILSWNVQDGEVPGDIKIGHAGKSSANNPSAINLDGHILQISDMINALERQRRPLVDEYEGRKPIEIIMAVYESSRTGKRVDL